MVSVIVHGFVWVTKAAQENDLLINLLGLSQHTFSSGSESYIFQYLSNYDLQLTCLYLFLKFRPDDDD